MHDLGDDAGDNNAFNVGRLVGAQRQKLEKPYAVFIAGTGNMGSHTVRIDDLPCGCMLLHGGGLPL